MNDYDTLPHEKFKMRFHIIFSTKYRRKVFNDVVVESIKEYMNKASKKQRWTIEVMEIDAQKPDHIHFLINSNPNIAVKSIINRLKQFSTFYIWKEHEAYMKRFYWKKHILWTRGFFCSTIGDASTKTIMNYIKNQG